MTKTQYLVTLTALATTASALANSTLSEIEGQPDPKTFKSLNDLARYVADRAHYEGTCDYGETPASKI